jgi:polyribonucleotide nucleotidyltransferase
VVNITKFGAFVNILPGRDGLLHISKMGGGKRIERVEDVLELGQAIEVRVDDVDPNGKVSLSPVTALAGGAGAGGGGDAGDGGGAGGSDAESVSFEDAFDAELREEFGDLGPASAVGGDRGGDRGSDRGDRRGGDRNRRGGGGGRGRR